MIKIIILVIAMIQTKTGNLMWHLTATDCDKARTACYNANHGVSECDDIETLCQEEEWQH